MGNSRLVYSTESGRICPSCGNPTAKCTCKKKKAKKKQQVYPDDGVVRIRREVKGRKGKTVTSIFGVPLENQELKQPYFITIPSEEPFAFAGLWETWNDKTSDEESVYRSCTIITTSASESISDMKYYLVSKHVNSVKNNDPTCIKPITDR